MRPEESRFQWRRIGNESSEEVIFDEFNKLYVTVW